MVPSVNKRGAKVHMVVDTLGYLLVLHVHQPTNKTAVR